MKNLVVGTIDNQTVKYIAELADLLLANREEKTDQERKSNQVRKPERKRIIVPFIGAGPSSVAKTPSSVKLMKILKESICNKDNTTKEIYELESRDQFDGRAIRQLNLFELASVITRLKHGRNAIKSVITDALSKVSHRPLAYELIAHLEKHDYIDHIVSLNFDELLDEALQDELSNLKIIATADDVPSPHAVAQKFTFFFHMDSYDIKGFSGCTGHGYILRSDWGSLPMPVSFG